MRRIATITTESIYALESRVPFKKSNTEVVGEGSIYYLKVFGNKIAAVTPLGKIWITNAGCKSTAPYNAIKERLNGFQFACIHQRKGGWYLNGKAWDGKPTYLKHNDVI